MIHVNFGWLNDYSGSKFAPFTLADKVLLNTENNTTESFYDFVKNQNVILSEKIYANQGSISALEQRFYGLTGTDDEDLKSQGIDREVAKQAMTLVSGPNTYLKIGSNNNPVYFSDGIPHSCLTDDKSSEQIQDIGAGKYITGWDEDNNAITYQGTTFEQYTCKNQLNANISGMSSYATNAGTALKSILSDISENSVMAETAKCLRYNIQFGALKNDGKIDYSNSDITGIIYTKTYDKTTDIDQILYTDGIQLKNVLEIQGNESITLGGKIDGNVSAVSIPIITVDKKGRIIDYNKDFQWTPQLQVLNIQNATDRGERTKFPLLTATGSSSDGYSYFRTQTIGDDTNGIYIEWTGDNTSNTSNGDYCVLMGAAWNDYAEFRNQIETIEPGYCVASSDDGKVYKTTEKFQACDGIVSDTFGFSIGKTETYQTPLAVSGRVLAYCEGNREDYHSGDTVCAGPEGKVCKMTREEIKEYPDRIVGIVSEIPNYEKWNSRSINDRIWIKVK